MQRMIDFTKMQGAGNDYIYVNAMRYDIAQPERLAVEWSKPHTGIGSDGLILIGASTTDEADFSMRIFNNDGSEAMMCGNGARCVAKYLYDKGITKKNPIRLQTLSGIKVMHLAINDCDEVTSVTIDMGEPEANELVLEADGRQFPGTSVSMGNPHFVTFVDDIGDIDIERFGRLLEHDQAFPHRCNIEFAQVIEKNDETLIHNIRTRVWERGSGVTMACGTGACATAVAAFLTGRAARKARITMDGGELQIEWKTDNHIYLTGPAEIVFEGTIALPTPTKN